MEDLKEIIAKNLTQLRTHAQLTQIQLAEKLNYSDKAVSKWESGSGYPETDKLISICEIFECSIDEILKGKISENTNEDKAKYENLMNRFSKGMALAVGLRLVGVTIFLYFAGFEERYSIIGLVILLLFVLMAVPIFIILGMEQENYKKKNTRTSKYVYRRGN